MSFSTETVIGMEIHAELKTKTKLFCSCSREANEFEKPNTRTCPVCLGHPGSKPVLNRKAVEYAIRVCLATGCAISPALIFSRKSYFYPDLAKNYQISQYEQPLGTKGSLSLDSGKEIGITRVHMEEDPASLVHPAGVGGSSSVLVDYNRSGNPLCEIVTEPDLETPDEAREFLKKLTSILNYLDVFDADSCIIKADANISIKGSGYTRVEIKNITGYKEVERALRYEITRQRQEVSSGGRIIQETRGWDADKGLTFRMRTKETEDDYGYIIDPDLTATAISAPWVRRIKEGLPELAHEKETRYVLEHKISIEDARVIAAEKDLARLFEKVAEKVSPILAARWLRRELVRVMNYSKIDFSGLKIDEKHLSDLLTLVEQKRITEKTAQKLMEQLIKEPFDVHEHVEKNGLASVNDDGAIEEACSQTINANPQAVSEYKAGSEKALNFLIGQVMRQTKGKADPKIIREKMLAGLDH